MNLKSTLPAYFLFATIAVSAQTDFRNRMWKDPTSVDVSELKLRFDAEGRVLDTLPQHLTAPKGKGAFTVSMAQRNAAFKKQLDAWQATINNIPKCCAIPNKELSIIFNLIDPDRLGPDCPPLNIGSTWPNLSHYRDTTRLRLEVLKRSTGLDEYATITPLTGRGYALLERVTWQVDHSTIGKPGNQGTIKLRIAQRPSAGWVEREWLVQMKTEFADRFIKLENELNAALDSVDQFVVQSEYNYAKKSKIKDRAMLLIPTTLGRYNVLRSDMIALELKARILLAEWQVKWLWYTNGKPTLTPFGRKPDPKEDKTLDILVHTAQFESRKTVLQENKAGLDPSKIETQLKNLKSTQLELLDLVEAQKKYEKQVANWKSIKVLLNAPDTLTSDVLLITSGRRNVNDEWRNPDKQEVHLMRHHDAARAFGLMNGTVRKEYYTQEQVHTLVHNYQGDKKDLSLALTLTDIEQTAALTEILNDALKVLTEVVNDPVKNTNHLIASKGNLSKGSTISDLINQLDTISKYLRIRKQETQLARETFELLDERLPMDPKARFTTVEVLPDKQVVPKKKVTYVLNVSEKNKDGATEKKPVATGEYNMYKLQRVQVVAGASLTLSPIQRTTATLTNNTLDVERKGLRHGFYAGLKVHPFGGGVDTDEDRFIVHARRLGIMLAVGLPKPLDDLYAGLDYTLVPGLNIALMCRWVRSDAYTLSGGQFTERRDVYARVPAVGLSVDSSVFTNLAKLLAK